MGQGIVRGRLRSRLLVGVATAALTIPASRWAQAQDAAKWSPYIELGGMGGTRSWGDVDIFVPLWQDQGSLLFGDLRGTFTTQPTEEGNFGLGYRTQVSPEWILGGYGYFDIQNSENNNLYYQITLGAELKSVDWDFRVNGYIPLNPDGGIVNSQTKANIQITGNLIQLNSSTQKEKALYGFDGEVGWRVPVFPADGDMDIRVYAGGYYFTNSDVDTIAGPRGRIEARLYDIDFLGMQSRLTAQGVIQWDQPRGTQGFGGLELRIPLGAITGAPGPKLNPLDRRMVDRVQRDVDIVSELGNKKRESEDVIVDELTVSTHTIVFANSGGNGATGAQGDPTDLNHVNTSLDPRTLNGNTGSNAIIVADGAPANINVSNPLRLLPGQALIGGGSVVGLTGVKTHLHVNFLFPGSRPTVAGNNGGNDLIVMASGSQNRITGLNLTGLFSNGIFGADMERAIVTGNSIDGSQATGQGILLVDDPAPSEFIHITGNTIFNMPENAIEIDTAATSGGVFSQSVLIENNTVTSTGIHGIVLYTFASSGGLVQNLAILGNTISSTEADGILLKNGVVGPLPGSLDQNGQIAGNHIADVDGNGIWVDNSAVSSNAVFQQVMAILGNTISDAAENGIAVTTEVQDVPGVTQAVAIDGNWISNVARNGIFFDAEVDAFGGLPGGTAATLAQTFAIDNNVISDTGENGILDSARLFSIAGSPTVLTQAGEINGNQVTGTGYEGIAAFTTASGGLVAGSSLNQALHIDNNTVTDVNQRLLPNEDGLSVAGIHVATFLYNLSHATQSIVIDPNIVSDVTSGNGIEVFNSLSNSTLSQSLEIASNVVSGIDSFGIVVGNVLPDFAPDAVATSLSQAFNIAGNSVTGGTFGIIVFNALATETNDYQPVNGFGSARLTQVGLLSGNVVTGASIVGIGVGTYARGFGASFNQNLAAIGNTVSSGITSTGTGIAFYTTLYRGARGTQNLLIADNTVADMSRDGIFVKTVVSARGVSDATTLLTQGATITGNQVTGSGDIGIRLGTYVSAAQISDPLLTAGVVQTLQVAGNTVVDSGGDGILVANNVFADGEGSSAFLSQAAAIFANRVDVSGEDGIQVSNSVSADHTAGATLSQSVAIDNNIVTNTEVNGIEVDTSAKAVYFATANVSQSVAVNNNTVTSSGVDGIFVATYASGYGFIRNGTVRLTQTVVVDPNTVLDSRVGDGIGVHSRLDYLGSSAVQSITIAANSVTGSGRDGVYVGTTLSAASMTQTITVAGNSISDSGENGIEVRTDIANFDDRGGATVLSQHAVIDGNRISDSGENGILVTNDVFTDGEFGRVFLTQQLAVDGNVVSNSVDNGILVDTQIQKFNYATATVSQNIAIDGNTVVSSGLNGIEVSNGVFADGEGGHVFLSQLAAIDGNVISNSVENGILVDSNIQAVNYGTATVTQGIAIDDNTIANSGLDGILVSTFARAQAGTFGGAVVNLDQSQTIDPNIITNSGRDGIAVKTQLYYVFNAQQSVTIAGNIISASGRDGVYVGTSLRQGSTLSQSLLIAGNSITHSGSNGIQVANLAEDRGATLAQTAAIVANSITSSGLNGIFVSNYVKGTGNNFISQSLAIAGNTVDGVLSAHVTAGTPSLAPARDGGNGILVRNNIAAYQRLVQSVAVQGNVVTNVTSFDGIYIKTLADKNATATQTFTVAGNHAFHAFSDGGYGVALKTVVSDHVGSQNAAAGVTQSIAVTGNTLDNNLYGGIGLFVIASAGNVVQNGSIAGNILTNAKAHFGEGIDALGLAGSSAVVSQSFAVNNNFITGNGVGVYLRAGDRVVAATGSNPAQILTGGVVSQSWTFTSNAILSNNANFVSGGISAAGHGLYGLVSGGTGTTQIIDLVSGNVISGNSGDGVRLFAFGNANQTATLHSNLGVDPHNTITSNGTNLSSNGGVHQSVTP